MSRAACVAPLAALGEVADNRGRTAVAVLHDVAHIVALKDGLLAFEGPPDDVLTEERLGALDGTPVTVRKVDGRPVALRLRLARRPCPNEPGAG